MDLIKESLLKSAAVTALVLLVGILVGLQADDAREGYIEGQLRESNLQTQTFIVTQNYLEGSGINYCSIVEDRIPDISSENREIGQNLQSFSSKSISNEKEYTNLRREYYLSQLRLYNVISEYKNRCNQDTKLIFFFFDSSTESKRQGAALSKYYKEVDNSTYIFSYNLETKNSEILDMLKTDFEVQNGPAIVVNGNQTYRRYVPYGQLPEAINGTLE